MNNSTSIDAPNFVLVSAGSFWMGTDNDPEAHPNEKPRHRPELDEYWIGTYPTTNAEYAQFVQANKHPHPSHWQDRNPSPDLLNHPVVNVSYYDAVAYCEWLSRRANVTFRLPTEQEWEKAARGATAFRYVWGNEWHSEYCNTREYEHGGTTPVNKFTENNRSQYGAVDMLGNVWELTDSWYRAYPNSRHQSSKFGEKYKIVRGGAWNAPKKAARISTRGRYSQQEIRPYLGFRLAATPKYTISNRESLYDLLQQHSNLDEIEQLCFVINGRTKHNNLQYENLSGLTLKTKTRSLVEAVQTYKAANELRQYLLEQRAELTSAWLPCFNVEEIIITLNKNDGRSEPHFGDLSQMPDPKISLNQDLNAPANFKSAIFAVQDEERNVYGTGFFVNHNRQIIGITCAHVIADLADTSQDGKPATINISLFQGGKAHKANVVWNQPPTGIPDENWSAKEDIAILQFPNLRFGEIKTLSLNQDPTEQDSEYTSFGFIQSKGRRGADLDSLFYKTEAGDGFIELDQRGETRIEKGVSGAPVIYNGTVIGILQAIDRKENAYLIPTRLIEECLNKMEESKK